MMKILNSLIVIGFILIQSCVSEKDFLMKRVRPAAYTFPQNCNNVLFVNELYRTDSVKYHNNNSLQTDQTKVFEAIIEEVLNQNFFDSIHTVHQTEPKSLSYIVQKNYPQAEIAVVISNLKLQSVHYASEENPNLVILGSIELNISHPNGSIESHSVALSDTVFSHQYDELLDPNYLSLLFIQNACYNLTNKTTSYLLPYLIEENRKIFSWSDVNTRDAIKYLRAGNTENARIIWTELLKIERKPRYQAFLYSNLGFLAENENNEEKALEYIRLAQLVIDSSSQKKDTKLLLYLKDIEQSILGKQKESELLKKQYRY